MNTATQTQTRTLEIDGMNGDACVTKVTGALKAVSGVETQSVKVGSATIKSDKAGCDAACTGITAAGFRAHEEVRPGTDGGKHADNANDRTHSGKGQPQHPGATPSPAMAPAAAKPSDSNTGHTGNTGTAAKPAMK